VELGTALGGSGRRADARDRLRTGLDLARRCGATPLAERAAEALAAEGARPRPPHPGRADALTPAEHRVARMAAAGMGDREIAQALFVTQRTVELRLSAAFAKLEIGSRTQLADALI
jgi:DNA-binding NarL/FixJ family response regulator